MKDKKALTEADEKTLQRLPDDRWFGLYDVHYGIKNPYYRCERLVERGKLESRVVGDMSDLTREWRKVPEDGSKRKNKTDGQR